MSQMYPWSSFNAFLKAIDELATIRPNIVDASMLSFSKSYGDHIISNFQFFGFVTRNNRSTDLFKDFLENENKRPAILREATMNSYKDLFSGVKSIEDITEEFLVDYFSKYSPSIYTKRKMVAFFKNIAIYSEIPISATSRTRVSSFQDEQLPLFNELKNGANIDNSSNTDYHLVSSLIQQLPHDGRWTQKQRDKWLAALTANIDLLIDIIPNSNDNN